MVLKKRVLKRLKESIEETYLDAAARPVAAGTVLAAVVGTGQLTAAGAAETRSALAGGVGGDVLGLVVVDGRLRLARGGGELNTLPLFGVPVAVVGASAEGAALALPSLAAGTSAVAADSVAAALAVDAFAGFKLAEGASPPLPAEALPVDARPMVSGALPLALLLQASRPGPAFGALTAAVAAGAVLVAGGAGHADPPLAAGAAETDVAGACPVDVAVSVGAAAAAERGVAGASLLVAGGSGEVGAAGAGAVDAEAVSVTALKKKRRVLKS